MSTQNSDFYRTLTLVMVSLGVFFVIIIVAANWISEGTGEPGQDPRIQANIEKTIKPVGQVNTDASAPAPAAAGGAVDGKATFTSACFACHGTGAAGAPKVGDKAAWGPRIAQGNAKLHEHALKGFQGKSGFMPAKGGNASLSDDAVKAAVDYMVSQAK